VCINVYVCINVCSNINEIMCNENNENIINIIINENIINNNENDNININEIMIM